MGNYQGNIRCSHCYGEGHNKRTCPTRLERLQRNYEVAKNEGGYAGYYGRQLARMTGTDPDSGESVARRYEGMGRSCSYCSQRGHNRRKCETLASDRHRYAALTCQARQNAKDLLVERGIGVGAMIQHERWSEKVMYLVHGLSLDLVHARNPNPDVVLRPMTKAHQQTTMPVRPDAQTDSYTGIQQVVGPLKPEQVAAQISDEWIVSEPAYGPKKEQDGTIIPNDIFVKGERRDTRFWQEQDRMGNG